jgi:hypothetical protein
MGKYSEILATIEELWMGTTDDVSVISDKVFEEYGIRYSEEDINGIITEWAQNWREAQDQDYLTTL